MALLMGGTIIGAEFFLSGCKTTSNKVEDLFGTEDVSFFNEVGDVIIPETNTPGAKATNVGGFMAIMVRDCYKPEDQKIFLTAKNNIDKAAQKQFDKDFLACDMKQRTAVLNTLDTEQKEYNKHKDKKAPNHYFRMVKELTLLGYFTSKPGCTQALRYVAIPGKFEGDVPYKKGDRAWATR
ncbi:hypothetical protein RG47T_4339 [Mucilaginibacter polytrichastri]|uniref:Twin-arginine translocation pathway signal n=1 Tax=Mucilaginibacter polytrichastri TaxID=1302689 RepID=A0A1Q6A4B5_9SPHI|nr:hypothetical protein RG47T_4339 [Mucilaginibacter polytrichastri]